MIQKFRYFFLVVIIICAIDFFEFQPLKGSIFRYLQGILLLVAIFISIPFFNRKPSGFIRPVQLIVMSVLISIFISIFTWNQSLLDSIIGSTPILIIIFFFYLLGRNFSIKKVENIVVGYGVLYLILYFFQFSNPSEAWFIDTSNVDTSRGILRIVFPGRGIFYLTSFIAISRLTSENRSRLLWFILSLMGIVVTIMQVTRQFIVAILLIYIYHFTKNLSLQYKFIAVVGLFCGSIWLLQMDNPIVKSLKEVQEQTVDAGDEYIRIKSANFFLTDFSKYGFNRIFGNGVPYGENSPYMKYVGFYVDNYGYWLSDVGLISIYTMFGIFAVIGFILIWVKSIAIKVPESFYYLKYYLWFLLLTAFTSDTIYSSSDIIATTIVLFIYQKVYEIGKFIRKLDLVKSNLYVSNRA